MPKIQNRQVDRMSLIGRKFGFSSSGMALALCLTVPAYAQDAEAPTGAEEVPVEGEAIVVTGIRASLDNALRTKRDADQIVDSITAEDAGKFPDQNVAESLQRISGIQIQRSADSTPGASSGNGEGSKVSVRGLRPDLAKVLFNGSTIATTSGGRDFDFSNLPSELISSVNVYKSPSASQEEGGIGGIIDVQTRSPLTTGKLLVVGSARGTYQELADKLNYRLSGLVNTLIGSGRNFGVLFGATYTDDKLRRDSVESFGWDYAPAPFTGLIARDFRTNLKQEHRTKLSLNATAEWEPSDTLNIRVDGLFTEQKQREESSNYQLRVGQNSRILEAQFDQNGTGVYVRAAPGNASQQWHRVVIFDREDTQRTRNILGKITWTPGEWTVVAKGGYTHGTFLRDPALNAIFAVGGTLSYDLRSGDRWPVLGSSATDPYNPSPAAFKLNTVARGLTSNEDTEKFGQLDLAYDLDLGPISAIRFGGKYGDRQIAFVLQGVAATAAQIAGFTLADFLGTFPVSNLLNADSSPNLPRSWAYPDPALILARFSYDGVLANPTVRTQDATQNYTIGERVLGGYGQLDLESGALRGNVGIRVVKTWQDNEGFLVNGNTVTPQSSSRDYINALPSLNLSYDLSDDLKLRFGASKAMTRAAFSELSNAATVNIAGGTATVGNPDLEPYKSNNLDLTLEWYFARGGLLAGGFFYKDVNSFVTTAQTQEVLPGISPDPFLVNRPVNGKAKVKGLELSYQQNFTFLPAPFDGLGMLANYTYVDSSSTFTDPVSGDALPLPGTSKHSGNIVAFYEKDWFSTRLAYNVRSKYILFPLSLGGQNIWRRAYDQLDATMSFDVAPFASIVLQATNLLKSNSYDYAGIEDRWVAFRDTGRTFSVEARIKL